MLASPTLKLSLPFRVWGQDDHSNSSPCQCQLQDPLINLLEILIMLIDFHNQQAAAFMRRERPYICLWQPFGLCNSWLGVFSHHLGVVECAVMSLNRSVSQPLGLIWLCFTVSQSLPQCFCLRFTHLWISSIHMTWWSSWGKMHV